jgi:hypothetical protein
VAISKVPKDIFVLVAKKILAGYLRISYFAKIYIFPNLG